MIQDFIKRLEEKGVKLRLFNDELKVFTKNSIDQDLLIQLKQNKEILKDYFKNIKSDFLSINRVGFKASYALSSAQLRLWVLNKFEGAETAYNISEVSVLKGALNEDLFQKAYTSLLARHEVLRTRFTEDLEGTPRQEIVPIEEADTQITIYDYRGTANQEEVVNQQIALINNMVFDLSKGPLIKCS